MLVDIALLVGVMAVGLGTFLGRAWLWRLRGDLLVVSDDRQSFTTEIGRFAFDAGKRTLGVVLARDGTKREFALGAGARVLCVPDVERALLTEALGSLVGITNFGITDFLPRYHDYTKKVAILIEDGKLRIPLLLLQQYKAVDMYDSLGGGNAALRAIYSGFSLLKDIDAIAEARAFEIADALRHQGLAIS